MTNQSIYRTIFAYWQELRTPDTPSIDRCIWRMRESDKIYNCLMTYQTLCIQHDKDIKM
jgi:hypothetical protein